MPLPTSTVIARTELPVSITITAVVVAVSAATARRASRRRRADEGDDDDEEARDVGSSREARYHDDRAPHWRGLHRDRDRARALLTARAESPATISCAPGGVSAGMTTVTE